MNVKAARGQTAMTFALTNGCNAIVDMLEKHQAILDAEEAVSRCNAAVVLRCFSKLVLQAKRIKERGEGRSEDVQVHLQFFLSVLRQCLGLTMTYLTFH